MALTLADTFLHRDLGTLLGVAGIIATMLVAAIVFYMQRDTKTLDWQLLTDEPIITSAADEAKEGIRVFWHDKLLQHPRILTVRLINTGRQEIRPEDFDGEVIINTPGHLSVTSAYAVRRRDGMRHEPDCLWSSNWCKVESILYNRGDWVDFQLLVDNAPDDSFEPTNVNRAISPSNVIVRMPGRAGKNGNPVTVDAVIAGQTRRGKLIDPITRPTSGGTSEGLVIQNRQLFVVGVIAMVTLFTSLSILSH